MAATQLSMILVRFAGEHAARQALAAAGRAKGSTAKGSTAKGGPPGVPQAELVIEADEHGKRRVIDPTMGPAAVARADLVSWGGFGLVYGLMVRGFAGTRGAGAAERGLVTGIAWGAFGIVAGALFGLWSSPQRLRAAAEGDSAWAPGPVLQLLDGARLGWGLRACAAVHRWLAPGFAAAAGAVRGRPARARPGGAGMSAGALAATVIQAQGVHIGGFKWTGSFTTIDLIAATTNALNGAILARLPDHYRNFTIVGVLLMALLGGIGGGVTRDVLLNKVPSALTNPAYILLCLAAGIVGYQLAFSKGQLFREGLFQFMTSFSLPWYAIAWAEAAEKAGLPVLGVLLLAVVGPTAVATTST